MKTNGTIKYQETVFSRWLTIIPGLLGLAIAGFGAWALISDTFGQTSAGWTMIGTGLFVVIVAANLAVLRITVTSAGVKVRYGVFSYNVALDDIASSYPDRASGVAYGGFGVRFAYVDNRRRVAYTVMDAPRVVLRLDRPANREFVFSTRDPQAVLDTLGQLGVATA